MVGRQKNLMIRTLLVAAACLITVPGPQAPRPGSRQAPDPLAARAKGRADAPVTVYEMSDFQCPYCREFALGTMPVLEREYIQAGKVRFVYINLPLTSVHKNAASAAEVALCAARQQRFWAMHDLLFRHQDQWAALPSPRAYLLALGDSAGLDRAGPLFRAINGSTFNATSLGTTSACCTGFNVQQGGQLVATTNLALIQLVDSVFDAGPDAQSGGNFIGLTDSGLNGPLTASATVSLAGPLVSRTTSNIRALFSALSVTRSTLTSTSPDALIQLNGTRANAPALLLGGVNTPFGNVTTTGRL